MFTERRKDRRRGYSFRKHFDRVRKQKGLGRIALSLCGTAFVAGGLFANCRGESLTGPTTRGGDVATGNGPTGTAPSHSIDQLNGKTFTAPYDGMDENKCNGESVPVKGTVSYTLFPSSLDVTHFKVQSHWVIDGTGIMGNVYHGDDQFLDEINSALLPLEWTTEQEITMHSSTAPDYRSKWSFHLTINANGDVTATVGKGPTLECSQ